MNKTFVDNAIKKTKQVPGVGLYDITKGKNRIYQPVKKFH